MEEEKRKFDKDIDDIERRMTTQIENEGSKIGNNNELDEELQRGTTYF